jgi:hypothetical protein
METGTDWVVFLPPALFRTRNISSQFSLTPFEILYEAPTPLTVLIEPTCCYNNDLYAKLKGLHVVKKKVWSQLATANEPGTSKTSHQFQLRDPIYVHLHHAQTLEHCWKDPCLVQFTTPSYPVSVLNLWPMHP